MPRVCSNSWQADGCEWSIGHLWRTSDWIERLIFVALALMLAYTVFILSRFLCSYYLSRRESRAFEPDSTHAFQRNQTRLVANLSRGVRTLKSISSAAPFLGLAGTCYGIAAGLFVGIGMERRLALAMISANVAAALVTAAAGILVAIPANLSYNFVHTRIDELERELNGHRTDAQPLGRSFQFAQKLPLQNRFSGLPPFALLAAPALASLVAIFTLFQPYDVPTGLSVRLLEIGSLDSHRFSTKPVIISVVSASANGSPVIRVNSRETTLDNLDEAMGQKPKAPSQWTAYVEAESSLPWGDVVSVIDVVKGLHGNVVLLTTTPDTSSRYTQRSATPTK